MILAVIPGWLYAQTEVSLVNFSSRNSNEFSPVYYQDGLVYCSDVQHNSLLSYSRDNNKMVNLYVAGIENSKPIILAKELTTLFNDGPATFNKTYDTIYFTRNLSLNRKSGDTSGFENTLGIFRAELINGIWNNITPFEFNGTGYSVFCPSLAPDGNSIFFCSDMPGGIGGTDIYFCKRTESGWDKPVNLGDRVNTTSNETYPFISGAGLLFFASDGHPGFGGKDIYYTQLVRGQWIDPVHLEGDVNSPYNDFGLVTDDQFIRGYFSSDRLRSDDIYSFKVLPEEFSDCKQIIKNNYCYSFSDEFKSANDTLPVRYEWDMGDGTIKSGHEVRYCFPGPGSYTVTLSLIDSLADTVMTKVFYQAELADHQQVFINSPDAALAGSTIQLDGLKSDLPGFSTSEYLWDFGEGFTTRGPLVEKTFVDPGEYTVKLGLLGIKDSLDNYQKVCASKTINIYNDYQQWAAHSGKLVTADSGSVGPDPGNSTPGVKIFILGNVDDRSRMEIEEAVNEWEGWQIRFDNAGMDSSGYQTIDRFTDLLNTYQGLKLYVAVHTGNKGTEVVNMEISQRWASIINSYLSAQRLPRDSFQCIGFGESRPENDEKPKRNANLVGRSEFIFHK